jgi:D-3-phosphoglycerate dehydrogenase
MTTSFPRENLKIVFIEKIHPAARVTLQDAGYKVEQIDDALDGEKLFQAIADAHIIGVRSRTKLTAEALSKTRRLLAVGCFSVGTDQVDLNKALELGAPVFNAPHSSTRSVAELAIGSVFMLARRAFEKSHKLHLGIWDKSISNATEVRGKTIGIVGYGHIGQQVGLLAESVGMQVLFYDVQKKLPLGNARPMPTLESLLAQSMFVSLHIPGNDKTEKLIGKSELDHMPRGGYLLNLARGKIVDVDALKTALESGQIGGAALDVFPIEPAGTVTEVKLELAGYHNVILTPHIGGNTEEAQRNIGKEVADSLLSFIELGNTEGAVNFPSVNLPHFPGAHRILNIHKNVPGALSEINKIVSGVGANIESQYLSTYKDIGYLIMDVNREVSKEVKTQIEKSSVNLKTRVLY